MSPEKQRIKIAEACGWRVEFWPEIPGMDNSGRYSAITPGNPPTYGQLPDYLNDLNACHEMEKVLLSSQDPELWTRHDHWLDELGGAYPWHATAAQRAEAFLRTLGLWEESKQPAD